MAILGVFAGTNLPHGNFGVFSGTNLHDNFGVFTWGRIYHMAILECFTRDRFIYIQ